MDRIVIRGGKPLSGEIAIRGAKNAALPLMAAGMLTDERLVLSNVPKLADIETIASLLSQHGIAVDRVGNEGRVLSLGGAITNTEAPYDIVRKMRASILVLGPLLARCREARVSLPGGCAIGARPVDLHLKALEALGAHIDLNEGYVYAQAPRGLKGATIEFPFSSVGATEHAMLAAVLADGETVLINAAREPEMADLADCLNAMGAKVEGAGTATIRIVGVGRLTGASHAVTPDRIETGTYALAAAMAGGEVHLTNTRADLIEALLVKMEAAGVDVERRNDGLTVRRNGARLNAVEVETDPYPGFATDLQAQFMALMTVADGESVVRETIFENRFMHVPELARLGADITVSGGEARVRGVDQLQGAPVMATDLRASVSLVIAALAARGETVVNRVYHLDRGFERLEEKLSACGANVRRIRGGADGDG